MSRPIADIGYWEENRLVDPDTMEGARFQERCTGIARRLYPQHDFDKEPIRFLIADNKTVNAHYISPASAVDPAEKRKLANADHIVIFHKGLVELFETEDQLAGFMYHELRHFGLVKD